MLSVLFYLLELFLFEQTQKSVLLIDPENIPSLGDVSEVKDLLLAMADRDGFSAPKLWECRSIRSCAAMTLFENNSFV